MSYRLGQCTCQPSTWLADCSVSFRCDMPKDAVALVPSGDEISRSSQTRMRAGSHDFSRPGVDSPLHDGPHSHMMMRYGIFTPDDPAPKSNQCFASDDGTWRKGPRSSTSELDWDYAGGMVRPYTDRNDHAIPRFLSGILEILSAGVANMNMYLVYLCFLEIRWATQTFPSHVYQTPTIHWPLI